MSNITSVESVSDNRPRVLVVDDDPIMCIYAREGLGEADFAVQVVEGGRQAVAAAKQDRPDLVILDVQMPGMNGFRVCEEIRRSPEGTHIPILMLTALDDLESIRRAYEAGATDFATKPANWNLLAYRLEYMLRSSRSASDLRESRRRLANAQRIAKLGDWEWNVATGQLETSSQMIELLELPAGSSPSRFHSFMGCICAEDRQDVYESLKGISEDGEPRDIEFRIRRFDGGDRFVRQRVELASDESNGELRLVGTVQDISDQKRAEDRVRFLSYYDGMTGLPNRRCFVDRLDLSLSHARRHERSLALLFIDLDRFNRINDTLGRKVGDLALQQVAKRLASFVRCTDTVSRAGSGDLVARFGGDEFALLLTDISEPRDAATVAARLLKVMAEPFVFDETRVFITASVGISLFPEDGRDAETLMASAEAAMYDTRHHGGDGYQYYSKEMNANTAERLALEADLSMALERGELSLHYQPQYDVASGRIIGAEALLRWFHPRRGVISPVDFIPIAEETGAIVSIGDWVLQAACAQARDWQRDGFGDLSVSVNVSGRQLERPDFPQTVQRALTAAGLEPRILNLELTESFLLEDVERAICSLEALKVIGVRISLDDFGVGYSSLSYLMRLPLDTLKIDRSFLNGIPAVSENLGITTAIIALARSVEMQVIAEGVETKEQHEFLRQHGCDALQGFLFSRPVPAKEFAQLLAQSQSESVVVAAFDAA